MERWTGTVAVVTGASFGIGAAICVKLVNLGINVVGLARRVEAMEELAVKLAKAPGKFYPKFCDVRDEKVIGKCFKWIDENLGGVSILINNAGLMMPTTLTDGDICDWKIQFDVNVLGLCICTKEAIQSMKKHGINGHIVHINSVAGHMIPDLGGASFNVYPATKFAVTALTECLRRELRGIPQPRIKISSVSPGLVATEFVENFNPELRDGIRKTECLKSEDIADSVLYCLGTPPHVQVHNVVVKVWGEGF